MTEKRLKSATLNLRIDPSVKNIIERAAEAERRSVTSLIEVVMTDWLRTNGYLKPSD